MDAGPSGAASDLCVPCPCSRHAGPRQGTTLQVTWCVPLLVPSACIDRVRIQYCAHYVRLALRGSQQCKGLGGIWGLPSPRRLQALAFALRRYLYCFDACIVFSNAGARSMSGTWESALRSADRNSVTSGGDSAFGSGRTGE